MYILAFLQFTLKDPKQTSLQNNPDNFEKVSLVKYSWLPQIKRCTQDTISTQAKEYQD